MAIPDDSITLLQSAVGVLRSLQTTAQAAGLRVQQVTVEFPPTDQANLVQFTWNEQAGGYDIATLT